MRRQGFFQNRIARAFPITTIEPMPGRTVWVLIGSSAQRTCFVVGREEFGVRVDTGFAPSGEDGIGADAVGSGGSAHTSSGARLSLDMIGGLRSIRSSLVLRVIWS